MEACGQTGAPTAQALHDAAIQWAFELTPPLLYILISPLLTRLAPIFRHKLEKFFLIF